MSVLVKDVIWFRFPKDQQLQFPAAAMVQHFVATYAMRMKASDPSSGEAVFQLEYGVDISQADWGLFLDAELELKQVPSHIGVPIGDVDMDVDFREAKIATFNKLRYVHVCQIFGMLCGEESMPVPKVRRIVPSTNGRWGILEENLRQHDTDEVVTIEKLLNSFNNEWKGIIGRMSVGTYLAASMGLPVIEIYPRSLSTSWLSKWSNRGYRMVIDSEPHTVKRQMVSAIRSIEEMVRRGIPCFPVPAVHPAGAMQTVR